MIKRTIELSQTKKDGQPLLSVERLTLFKYITLYKRIVEVKDGARIKK